MADLKISALTASTTPLAGTEVLPIVQSSTTKQVSVANLTAGRAVAMLTANVGDASGQNSVFDAVVGSATATTGDNTGLAIVSNATGKGWIGFNNANNSSIPGQVTYNHSTGQMGFRATGDYFFDVSNIVIGTSGKGIDFSATPGTGTSELLNDYETGTWTPVVNFGGVDGGSSYLLQSGYYTKVGNQVTAWCYAEIIAASAATGSMTVSGLPFTATSSSNFQALGSGGLDNAALPADQPVTRVFAGQSSITMMSGTGINNWATLTDTGVKNNGLRVYATVSYSV